MKKHIILLNFLLFIVSAAVAMGDSQLNRLIIDQPQRSCCSWRKVGLALCGVTALTGSLALAVGGEFLAAEYLVDNIPSTRSEGMPSLILVGAGAASAAVGMTASIGCCYIKELCCLLYNRRRGEPTVFEV